MAYKQSNWRTQIVVGGFDLGLADKWQGGEKTADNTAYRTRKGQRQLGGVPERGDGTATYLFTEELAQVFRQLDAGVGSLDALVTRTPCGDDGTPFSTGSYTMEGKLKEVPQPEDDVSSSDGATVELQFSLNADLVG